MGNRGLAMTTTRMTLTELNALDQDELAAKRAFLFEGRPWVAAQAWHARPFSSLAHLHRILSSVMFDAPHERQVALIAAHPDLAGKTALAGELSPESTGEQAAAGLNWLLPDEMAAFTQLNDAYRQTFGFPFVICIRCSPPQLARPRSRDCFESGIRLKHPGFAFRGLGTGLMPLTGMAEDGKEAVICGWLGG
jgi:2-oxo-4-hydroxy-4-carboxy-5-ureidoimidazoline decarboxylase